jgi:predicted transcriptional regulator
MKGETTMSIPGVPGDGFKTVGQIDPTELTLFRVGQHAATIAVELLSSHAAGGPVVDENDKVVGFISEIDVLNALEAGKELKDLAAEDIMSRNPIIVHESTTLAKAVQLMKENHLVDLPVERDGRVAYSVSRHDILRALVGIGPEE